MSKLTVPFLSLALALGSAPVPAQTPAAVRPDAFITLGTQGGPISGAVRGQPANALIRGADVFLVDIGDGTVQRLAAANIPMPAVRGVFISHMHPDHTAGLPAFLSLLYFMNIPGSVTVYGPPGMRQAVDGILAFMEPESNSGIGLPGQVRRPPSDIVKVVELTGDSRITIGDMAVVTAENSHYSFPTGSHEAEFYKSLSFRFDLPGRSIVYTGDTGPSAAVEQLAKGADIYVTEMIDLDATVAKVKRFKPSMPKSELDELVEHLGTHHVNPVQIGEMAARAGVKAVVVTHQVPGSTDPGDIERYKAQIGRSFHGPVFIAKDLDRF